MKFIRKEAAFNFGRESCLIREGDTKGIKINCPHPTEEQWKMMEDKLREMIKKEGL